MCGKKLIFLYPTVLKAEVTLAFFFFLCKKKNQNQKIKKKKKKNH